MRTLRRELKSNRGFTMIEMSIVITILALTAALVVPRMAAWREGDSRRALLPNLARLFGHAREDAIVTRSQRQVRFEESDRAFVATTEDPESGDEIVEHSVQLLSGIEPTRFQLNGNDVSQAEWLVTFYPDGSADLAGVELVEGDQPKSIAIDERGSARMLQSSIPEAGTEKWEAGSLEIRS